MSASNLFRFLQVTLFPGKGICIGLANARKDIPTSKPPSQSLGLHNDIEYFSPSIDKVSTFRALPSPKSAPYKSTLADPDTENKRLPKTDLIVFGPFSNHSVILSIPFNLFFISSAMALAAKKNPSGPISSWCRIFGTPPDKQLPK
ncbi:HXXXD-type acyl-transferase family protein [Striga asiatica]|uniref:HXXXD-type acyl-transferase family protein n=1 Tax=Striga asiatica TaxID=4170 RepID=A0A5A7PFD7_STRAF|nr:HXXXD-type acyl-transferase family protein [Striga asiatica]